MKGVGKMITRDSPEPRKGQRVPRNRLDRLESIVGVPARTLRRLKAKRKNP